VARGQELELEADSNFRASKALLYVLQEREGVDAEIKQLLLEGAERGHMLVRRRVSEFLA